MYRGKRAAVMLVALAVALKAPVVGAEYTDLFGEKLSQVGALTLTLAAASVPKQPAQKPKVWVLHYVNREPKEPESALPTYTAADAETIKLGGKSTYTPDKAALLTKPLPFSADTGVLIMHTHTSEAYTQSAGYTYSESDPLRTTDTAQSVVRVGQAVAEVLREKGVFCLHDTSFNDYPDYNGAYARSLENTQNALKEYPSCFVILDLHRDATEDADGNPTGQTVETAEGAAARCMLVVGTDEGGLRHDFWQDNLCFALKLQAEAERIAPGLMKPIDLRTERFNQHLRPGAILIEVGSTGNTLPEALASGRILARALLAVLGKG